MSGLYTAIGAAALSAAGTGVNAYSQNQNMRRQDNQAAAATMAQGSINQKAENAVSNLNNSIARSNPDAATKTQQAAYTQAAQQAAKVSNPTPTVAGG